MGHTFLLVYLLKRDNKSQNEETILYREYLYYLYIFIYYLLLNIIYKYMYIYKFFIYIKFFLHFYSFFVLAFIIYLI